MAVSLPSQPLTHGSGRTASATPEGGEQCCEAQRQWAMRSTMQRVSARQSLIDQHTALHSSLSRVEADPSRIHLHRLPTVSAIRTRGMA